MYRGGDLLEWLHGSVPDWLVLLAALVTRLGDVWVVIGITIAASWLLAVGRPGFDGLSDPAVGTAPGSRRRAVGPWPVGVLVGALALMTALKYAFALPRPALVAATPGALPAAYESTFVATVSVGGYGFPSGHAIGATVAYGLLAIAFRAGPRRVRFAVAGALVVAIALSRVVLAVHYPGDVVAGVALGVAYLAGVLWLFERTAIDRTGVAFALALGLALVAIAVSGAGGRSVTYAALAAGALTGWSIGRPNDGLRLSARSDARSATLGVGALVGLGAFAGGASAVAPAALLGGLTVLPAVVLADRAR